MNVINIIFILFIVSRRTRADILKRDRGSDIEDIILDLNPDVILNIDTPENSLIGTIIVLTYSKRNYRNLTISQDDPYFNLRTEKLYLKSSGAKLLQNINSIMLPITATDLDDPPGFLTKYVRIPVEHIKEDSVLKVNPIDDLCDNDFDRRLFSLIIDDPDYNPREPYSCHVSKSNYPDIKFSVRKLSDIRFDFYLPNEKNLFDLTKKPNLVLDVICSNSFIVTHKRTIDFKICKSMNRIKDIDYEIPTFDLIVIPFSLPINSVLTKLKVIDFPEKNINTYEFSTVQPIEYLDILSNGFVYLKQPFDRSLLKYLNAKISIKVKVNDRSVPGREIEKVFKFIVNSTAEEGPPLRFKAEDFISPILQFAQESELFIKLGQFQLNQSIFPSDRFDLRLKTGNVSLDDEGNLFISENPLKALNNSNQATIGLNVYDKKENSVVFEDVFNIDLPPINTISTTTVTPTRPIVPNSNPFIIECVTDKDCNRKETGPNTCIKLSSLKDKNLQNNNDVENLMRRFQFIANKDPSIFLKYNQILQALVSPSKDLYDTLLQNKLTIKDLHEIGVCLCDQDFQGFKCQTPAANDKPHQCHPNSTVPSCNPLTSICQPSEFLLRNNLQRPNDKLNEYRSYYCECTKEGTVGVNCEYQRDQCTRNMPNVIRSQDSFLRRFKRQQVAPPFISDPVRRYPASTLGSINNNTGTCDPRKDEFCIPTLNGDKKCLNPNADKTKPGVVNYLVFDESNRNPKFKDDPNRPNDKYKRLNLSDASVVIGVQNFIRDEVIPRFSYNDYAKIPKGPLGILRPSINMPNILNDVRTRLNSFISQNDSKVNDMLDRLTANRIQQLVQDTLLYLIANQKLTKDAPVFDSLKSTIDKLIDKLNLSDMKVFSTALWDLIPEKFPPNVTQSGLTRHLNALKGNSDKLDKPERLREILSLTANNEPYLDLFNFSNRPYSLLKLDILPGIYLDPDGELSLRPTPGIFLESLPKDVNSPNRELIFLPGIFNSAASSDCNIKTIFTPGIMSLPIDNYDLANLPNDANRYLNKFVPMQIPFNINGFLTPLRSSSSDTISSLLLSQDDNKAAAKSHILLTPLDFNPDASFDFITKNEKFMSNLFSPESLHKIVREQKPLDTQNLASTLVLSNPTMLPLSKQSSLNNFCLGNMSSRYNPKGGQFYNPTNPIDNVTVMPFILYDDFGDPIPADVVQEAIEKYCRNYQVQVNEFHARICDAQAQSKMLQEAQKTNPEICPDPNCPFTSYVDNYYNPKNGTGAGAGNNGKIDPLALLILATILGLLWLLWMLSMCCCLLKCCPLAAYLRRRKYSPNKLQKGFVITDKKSKVFGNPNYVAPRMDVHHVLSANGELVRSSAAEQANLKYSFNDPNATNPAVYISNAREKVFNSQNETIPTLPTSTYHSLLPKYEYMRTGEDLLDDSFLDGQLRSINSVNTNSTILIKQPSRLSTVISSSLINGKKLPDLSQTDYKQKPRQSMIISSQVMGKSFPNLDKIDHHTSRLMRQKSYSIADPTGLPYSTHEYDFYPAELQSSISYPMIDRPNFYRNHLIQMDLNRKNTKYNINRYKNSRPSYQLNRDQIYLKNHYNKKTGKYSSNISQINENMPRDYPTENLFKLKRLSNHIINPNDQDNGTYKKLDNDIDNDYNFYYRPGVVKRVDADEERERNENPLLFKLHRIGKENTEVEIVKPPNILERNQIFSNRKEHINYLPKPEIQTVVNDDLILDSMDKKQNEMVLDWLLRKCDSDEELNKQNNLKVTRIDDSSDKNSVLKCFVCDKRFSDPSVIANQNLTNLDELLYICDSCYESWYAPETSGNIPEPYTSIEDPNEDNNSDVYTYYIVRRKASRQNSTSSIVDVINIDNKKFKNEPPQFIEVKLPEPIENNNKRPSVRPIKHLNNDDSPNEKKYKEASSFRSSMDALVRDKKVVVVPTDKSNSISELF